MKTQPRKRSEFSWEYLAKSMDRFYRRCVVIDGGHWIWRGAPNSNGRHGWFRLGLKYNAITTHRAAWLLWRGDLPGADEVIIPCSVKFCVAPGHLRKGDRLGHLAERTPAKVKAAREAGEKRARLKPAQVKRVHRMAASGWTNRQLAARFGVCDALISHITTGRVYGRLGLKPLWRHSGRPWRPGLQSSSPVEK